MSTDYTTKLDNIFSQINTLRKRKELNKCAEIVLCGLQEYPDSRRLYAWLGRTYELLKDFDKAEHAYFKALSLPLKNTYTDEEVDMDSAEIEADIGYNYIKKGDYEKAISWFKSAIEKDRSKSYFYMYLGWAYDDLEDHEIALQYHNKSIEMLKSDPNNRWLSEHYVSRSYSLFAMSRVEEAYEDAQKSLELLKKDRDPADTYAWLEECNHELDWYYANQGIEHLNCERYEESENILNIGLKKVSYPIACNLILADLYADKGDLLKSLEYVNRANDNIAMHSITGTGDYKKDISNLYSIACITKGNVLKQLNRYTEAREAFHESLKYAPKQYDMTDVYEELEDLKWR